MTDMVLQNVATVMVVLPNVGRSDAHTFGPWSLADVLNGTGVQPSAATPAQIKEAAVRYADQGAQDLAHLQVMPTDDGNWLISPVAKYG